MASYSLGNISIRLAADRYLKRYREVCAEAEEAGETDLDHLLAATYLTVAMDMATLYMRATDERNLAESLTRMDAHVDDLLAGKIDE